MGCSMPDHGQLQAVVIPTLEGSASRGRVDAEQGWGKVGAGSRAWQEHLKTGVLTSRPVSANLSVT